MDFKLLIAARKALDDLWKSADLRGRCWGSKRKENPHWEPSQIENPYASSNITLAVGDELVTISMSEHGRLRIHEFRKVKGTVLGKKIKTIFEREGLIF